MALKKTNVTFWIIAFSVFIVDWVTKFLAKTYIKFGSSIPILKFFSITHITNTGTAFGLFKNFQWIFIVFSAAVIVFIILRHKTFDKLTQIALALVLGGAFGNLFDRIFYGNVIDFIHFNFWPAFNIADSAITIAIILLLIKEIKVFTRRKF